MTLDPALCYRALTSRDRRFDGRFFTGVTSTGIYCRPVCPARTPRADRVRFFACAAAAEEAGFRPCRRCRPESAPGTPAWVGSPAVVARALRLIDEGGLDGEDLPGFAVRLGLGERQLRRLFSTHVGVAPGAVARARRAHLARRLLDETALPMTEVALAAGYTSLRQFNHDLRQRYGAPPGALRARRTPPEEAGVLRLRLDFRPPLAADALLAFLAVRAIPGVESVSGLGYRRTIRTPEGAGALELRVGTGAEHVTMHLAAPGISGLQGIVARARRLFDLDADPALVRATLGRDPRLAAALARQPGLRVPGAFDPFECAVRAILGQQVTVRGATTLTGRLVARFGTPLEPPLVAGLTHLFPLPETLAEADLEKIGLPGARAATLRRLAGSVADGSLRLDACAGLEEFVARFTALPGIGKWTAHYVAMRAFGEPDALPSGDLVLRKALGAPGVPASQRALDVASDAWRPWRSYAVLHLWSMGEERCTSSSPRSPRRSAR